jgi:hypothetical protein
MQVRPGERTIDNPVEGTGARKTLPWGFGPEENAARSTPWTSPFEVAGQSPADIGGQRESFDARAFAPDQQFSGLPIDVLQVQLDDFAGPQAQSGQEQQHRVIPLPGGTVSVAVVQELLDLVWFQKLG